MTKVAGFQPTAEQLAAQAARRAAQAEAKAARKAFRGGRTIVNPNATGNADKFISSVEQKISQELKSKTYGKKTMNKGIMDTLKGYGKKVLDFAKTTKGKWAIGITAAVAVAAGVLAAVNKKHNEAQEVQEQNEVA